mmetsp:Transcript_15523/g.33669  ORF Transcript_15523/g.33669 Transcript_15523/m.33669 type:complete len:366 (+) Transcript_15523:78-1175(+)
MASSVGGTGDPKGLYQCLSVAVTATPDEIKKAYRRLALRWHPDKNPDDPEATAQFQKISAAYEVLADELKRNRYDSTGCVDQDELDEMNGFDHAADLFAAFFGGMGFADMDMEEQVMMDEFLRMAGSTAFKRRGTGRRRRKPGAKSNSTASAAAASRAARQEEQRMNEAFFSAFAGGAMPASTSSMAMECPQGHTMKKRKADAEYACDKCSKSIAEGKRFHDCRKCDFSVCQKCYKAFEAEAMEQQEDDEEQEIFQAVCEANSVPVRVGNSVQFKCGICNKLHGTQDLAVQHMTTDHSDEISLMVQDVIEESDRAGPFGAGAGPGFGFEELLMMGGGMMMMDELFMSGPMGGASRSTRSKGPRKR